MKIDAHQHFWDPARGDYGWLTSDLAVLYRSFEPDDLAPLLRAQDIDGTVLVQAAATVAETDYLLGIADTNAFILGVVGWVDLEAPNAAKQIADRARHSKLVGLRPMIQNILDTDWMLRDSLAPAFEAMIEHGMAFDALTLPKHLLNLVELCSRYPDLRVVTDHVSKPDIARGAFAPWAADMTRLANETGACVKLSGLVTEAGPHWKIAGLARYVDHLLAQFGPDRMIWGSDWPVCTLACSYARWAEATEALLAGLTAMERAAIMGGNAAKFYRLERRTT